MTYLTPEVVDLLLVPPPLLAPPLGPLLEVRLLVVECGKVVLDGLDPAAVQLGEERFLIRLFEFIQSK